MSSNADLIRALNRLGVDFREETGKAALRGGQAIEGEAKRRAPSEYGNLRASGYTKKTSSGAEVGFSANYALPVHENIEEKWRGRPRASGLGSYWNPGRSKFLESAANDKQKQVADLFRKALTALIRKVNK